MTTPPKTPFWRDLVEQDRLEEMYEMFRNRPEATDKEVAIRLARFAEARMHNAADRRITELEGRPRWLKRATELLRKAMGQ